MDKRKKKSKAKPRERCLNYHHQQLWNPDCSQCNGDNQSDCSLFAPMGDPQKCPECGEELSSVEIVRRVRWYERCALKQGALDTLYAIVCGADSSGYGTSQCSEAHEVERVECPKCEEPLPLTSIEEAKEFLKTGKLPKQEQ